MIERLLAVLILLAVAIVVVFLGLPLMVVSMWWLKHKWETKE